MQIKVQRLTRMALLLAVVIVLGLIPPIPLGLIPVPLTLQNVGILLIGMMLTPLEAGLTTGLFLLLTLIGLPILTGMRGGIAVFMGPTAGYLVGYLVASVLLAWWVQKSHTEWFLLFAKVTIVAVIVIDGLGIAGFALTTHISIIQSLTLNAIVIPGDIIKSAIIVMVACKLK